MDKAAGLAMIRARWKDIAPAQKYDVDFFRPEDAPGVVRLITEIYGEKYPVEDYYIPERIIAKNASGDVVTMVARTPGGDVVAQAAIWRTSSPNPNLYESGQMMVLPDYRKTFALWHLNKLVRRCVDSRPEIHGLFGEAVTNHLTIQKTAPIFNLKPCALEVALMPDGAYEGEGAGKKRVSCLTLAAVYRDRRQALHLPAVCRDDLMPILSLLALDRETTFSSGAVPSEPESGITLQRFDAAGVIRCHVDGIGADFSDCVRDIDRDAGAVSVVEVFLRADTAAAPWAVSVLRERGFFLSGFVPLWFGADAILMQKLSVAPDFDTIKLHSPEAQALGERVRRDYQRVQT